MKRLGNLYYKVYDINNLKLADKIARKGKLKQKGVKKHDRNKDKNILKLHRDLKNKTFTTSKYSIFTIYEPKEREIYVVPYFPDRIVHHAIMNILEKVFVSMFVSNTYNCIKKRGIHGAYRSLKKALIDKENTTYALKLDIRKFYPNINHNILKGIIRKKIKDNDLLYLIDDIIDSIGGGLEFQLAII